jgi:4-hydroxybutyrate dehydrogenase
MLSTFSFPTKIRFGPGAIAELLQYATSRPLLVTDGGLTNSALFQRVLSLIPNAAVYSGVLPNPTEQNVFDGLAAYRENDCDGIIGLGGGSPLDAAKAIRLKVTHPLTLAEYDDLIGGDAHITANLPPYIAIPTTSGTGSEVSRSTVITLAATNRKTVIFSPHLIPSVAIADPELTLALPPRLTAGTGMDALTHNVEAYLSKGYHPMCDAIALAGTKLAWDNLPKAMAHPQDLEARSNMMMASIMGAVAFQKGLGAVHSLAHPLSSDCGMHHGTANAVLLPAVIEYNESTVSQRLIDLFGNTNAAEQIRDLNAQLGIAPRLRDYGVTEEILPKLADKAIEDGCHQNNPRPCTREDLLALYRAAY